VAKKIRVAVVMGGVSGEHDVSLNSGCGVLKNLDETRYAGVKVVISRTGEWSIDDAPARPLLEACSRLVDEVDVVFLALHGPNGEDGTIQSLFHLLGLPYTGSDHYASSLAMNKPRAKDVYVAAGLLTAPHRLIRREDLAADPGAVAEETLRQLTGPVVAKTTKLGSSVGVGIAHDAPELEQLLGDFMPYDGEVLVEKFITGCELTAPVIDDPFANRTVALPLIEIRPRVSGWFDYRAKYELGGADEICPAPVSEELTVKCQDIGLLAHRILGCRGMSRTDMIVDAHGQAYVIETNTIPGFTQTSLLPQAAGEAGISYPQLVDLLIQEALLRSGD